MSEELTLTAKSWIILDNNTGKYWRGDNTMQKMEMASLTKMYTLSACLHLNNQLNIKPELCWVQILTSTQVGTQAELSVGKYLTLQSVYYGMMLPSGNDAALNLAYYYGYFIDRKTKFAEYEWKSAKNISIQDKRKHFKLFYARFVSFMNEVLVGQILKHQNTHFENPHGLSDKLQKSSTWEIGNAALLFLKNQKFSTIVQTQKYVAFYSDGQQKVWQNTNILLKQGYIGIKTGHTLTAGNCLCSRKVIYHNKQHYDLVMVVLGCLTLQHRFSETVMILDDFCKYLTMMRR